MWHLLGGFCLCIAASAAIAREPDPGGLAKGVTAVDGAASEGWKASDLPAPTPVPDDDACPFAAADPIRLAHLLGVAGAGAIRAEAPYRRAQSHLCSR